MAECIPNTELMVSTICLGTGEVGSSINREESFRLLDEFIEQGGNFIDTAHNYGDWVPDVERGISEKTIGAWLKSHGCREHIVLATKGAHWELSTPHLPRLSPSDIHGDIDESLQYLQTDYIDLYWLHRDDPIRPVEEIIDTLEEAVKAGKIRYYGASNWRTYRLRAAKAYAKAQGTQGFVADQVLWNAAVLAKPPYGDPDTGWMDEERYFFHETTGMAAIPFQSQAYGLFQRMHAGTLDQMKPGFRNFYRIPETTRRYERMRQVMQETGLTITQVVLGFLRGQPFMTVPIVGCQNPEQVKDSLSAAEVRLTPEQIQYVVHG